MGTAGLVVGSRTIPLATPTSRGGLGQVIMSAFEPHETTPTTHVGNVRQNTSGSRFGVCDVEYPPIVDLRDRRPCSGKSEDNVNHCRGVSGWDKAETNYAGVSRETRQTIDVADVYQSLTVG